MAFWRGIKQIFSGVQTIAETPGELLLEMKVRRRKKLSGKYVVEIAGENGGSNIRAHITYNGGWDMHDIDLVTYFDGDVDIWDDLSESSKRHVSSCIHSFINGMKD